MYASRACFAGAFLVGVFLLMGESVSLADGLVLALLGGLASSLIARSLRGLA